MPGLQGGSARAGTLAGSVMVAIRPVLAPDVPDLTSLHGVLHFVKT